MDMISRPYFGWMAFWADDPERMVKVKWRYCDAGAEDFPFPHAFGSSMWDHPQFTGYTVGEVDREPSPKVGSPFSSLPGRHYCGDDDVWKSGATEDTPDLEVDAEGMTTCCGVIRLELTEIGIETDLRAVPPPVDGGSEIVIETDIIDPFA